MKELLIPAFVLLTMVLILVDIFGNIDNEIEVRSANQISSIHGAVPITVAEIKWPPKVKKARKTLRNGQYHFFRYRMYKVQDHK
ncbi:hypothetical protein MTBBW1_1930006 [Desulfamplus magnetovallimortis]|uniref:Uncharacterized protein n=1 Tax=Desulfamplus magnetovallimortis TaxID=1246637 RepID=A0A1W1HBB5_9BACT|nr:hypothetical protein [Desulfamplus magnetovallimortis]SLM29668.1 hypothetical protein MTBBW1_1930006 [Desulfamplus magnetovallimortis]